MKKTMENLTQLIKKEVPVSKTEVVETDMGYSIKGWIYKGISIDYTVRKRGCLAILKIECVLKSDGDINTEIVAKELSEKTGLSYVSYDGKYVLQKAIGFQEEESKDVLRNILTDVINMIKTNLAKFEIETVAEEPDNGGQKDYAGEEDAEEDDYDEDYEDDPDYDDLDEDSDDDYDSDEDESDPDNEEDLPDEDEEYDDEDDNGDKTVPGTWKKRDVTRAENSKTEEPATEPATEDKKKTVHYIKAEQAVQTAATARNRHVKRTKIGNETMPSVKKPGEDEKMVKDTPAGKINPDNAEDAQDKPSAPVKLIRDVTDINTKLSEDTINDINRMYSDVTGLFERKAKEADERQALLDRYADRLKKQEEEIEIQKKQTEKAIIQKEIELEKTLKEKTESLEKEYTKKIVELEEVYAKKETELHEAQMAFAKQQEDLAVEKKKADLDRRKLDMEKSEFENRKKQLDEMTEIKNKLGEENLTDKTYREAEQIKEKYEQLKADYNSLVDENNEIIDENDRLLEIGDRLTGEVEKHKAAYEKSEEQRKKIKEQYDRIQSEKDRLNTLVLKYKKEAETGSTAKDAPDNSAETESLKEKITALETERDAYRSTAEELRGKEAENTSKCNELEDRLRTANEQIESLKAEKSNDTSAGVKEEVSIAQKAARIQDDLSKIGVDIQPVAGAGDTILSCNYAGCLICINLAANVLYIEKEVKKAQKYVKTFDRWNLEDIRVSYLVAGNKVICKYAYDDVLRATKDTLDKFETII